MVWNYGTIAVRILWRWILIQWQNCENTAKRYVIKAKMGGTSLFWTKTGRKKKAENGPCRNVKRE